MRYKNIIKRDQRDLTWIKNFLNEKLEGKEQVLINANEKMYI